MFCTTHCLAVGAPAEAQFGSAEPSIPLECLHNHFYSRAVPLCACLLVGEVAVEVANALQVNLAHKGSLAVQVRGRWEVKVSMVSQLLVLLTLHLQLLDMAE